MHAATTPAPIVNPRAVEAELRYRLIEIGVSQNQADYLLSEYPPDQIARQIVWLPHRKARNPAALIVRAIELDYAAPVSVPGANETSRGATR